MVRRSQIERIDYAEARQRARIRLIELKRIKWRKSRIDIKPKGAK